MPAGFDSCRATMPQLSARLRELAGGSTATTMRLNGGASWTRALSSMSRVHSASLRSSSDLAVELLTPQSRAGILRDDAFEKGRREIGGVLARQARVTTLVGWAISFFSSGSGRGVVVTSCRGQSPRRKPNCSMSQVSLA